MQKLIKTKNPAILVSHSHISLNYHHNHNGKTCNLNIRTSKLTIKYHHIFPTLLQGRRMCKHVAFCSSMPPHQPKVTCHIYKTYYKWIYIFKEQHIKHKLNTSFPTRFIKQDPTSITWSPFGLRIFLRGILLTMEIRAECEPRTNGVSRKSCLNRYIAHEDDDDDAFS